MTNARVGSSTSGAAAPPTCTRSCDQERPAPSQPPISCGVGRAAGRQVGDGSMRATRSGPLGMPAAGHAGRRRRRRRPRAARAGDGHDGQRGGGRQRSRASRGDAGRGWRRCRRSWPMACSPARFARAGRGGPPAAGRQVRAAGRSIGSTSRRPCRPPAPRPVDGPHGCGSMGSSGLCARRRRPPPGAAEGGLTPGRGGGRGGADAQSVASPARVGWNRHRRSWRSVASRSSPRSTIDRPGAGPGRAGRARGPRPPPPRASGRARPGGRRARGAGEASEAAGGGLQHRPAGRRAGPNWHDRATLRGKAAPAACRRPRPREHGAVARSSS